MNTWQDHEQPRLLFGRGYYIDFNQLAYLLQAINDLTEKKQALPLLAQRLGITLARTSSLIYFARGFELLNQQGLYLTPLASLIMKHDPFFEDIGTLWFLHYVVASEPRQLVWNRFVNSVIPQHDCFTLQQFREYFTDQQETHASYAARRHVQKETLTIIDAYINRNFTRLAYLHTDDQIHYQIGPYEAVPPLILGASIVRYRERYLPREAAPAIHALLYEINSPGVVFHLAEKTFRSLLERIKTQPDFSIESRADLDQIRLADTATALHWMERYYAYHE